MNEHQEQVAVIKWVRASEIDYPELELLYAIPNAAKRSPRLARYMKDEGLKAGVPDICLPVARCGYHGLYIELKRIGGPYPTPSQVRFLTLVEAQGYLAVCCKGHEAAISILERYIEGQLSERRKGRLL